MIIWLVEKFLNFVYTTIILENSFDVVFQTNFCKILLSYSQYIFEKFLSKFLK